MFNNISRLHMYKQSAMQTTRASPINVIHYDTRHTPVAYVWIGPVLSLLCDMIS